MLAPLLLGVLAACNTGGCYDNGSAIPLASYKSAATGQPVSVTSLEIRGIGAPDDSLLVGSHQSAQQVWLPMRSTATTTSWCFHYTIPAIEDPAWNDTLTFNYQTLPRFVSDECGAMYFYRITEYSYTTHMIDSVAVVDSLITNVDIPQIEILLRELPAEPDEPEEPENPEEPDIPGGEAGGE